MATRAIECVNQNRFDGWSKDQLRRYARARIVQHLQPGGPYTVGERGLLVEAWEHVLRRLSR